MPTTRTAMTGPVGSGGAAMPFSASNTALRFTGSTVASAFAYRAANWAFWSLIARSRSEVVSLSWLIRSGLTQIRIA